MRLQQASQPPPPPCYFLHLLFLLACCDFQAGVYCFDQFLFDGDMGSPFVLQVQTARMAQGVSCLLGVALSDRRAQVLVLHLLREPRVSQRGARDQKASFGFGLLGESAERRLQAFANRSNKDGWFGNLLCALCNFHKKD